MDTDEEVSDCACPFNAIDIYSTLMVQVVVRNKRRIAKRVLDDDDDEEMKEEVKAAPQKEASHSQVQSLIPQKSTTPLSKHQTPSKP